MEVTLGQLCERRQMNFPAPRAAQTFPGPTVRGQSQSGLLNLAWDVVCTSRKVPRGFAILGGILPNIPDQTRGQLIEAYQF